MSYSFLTPALALGLVCATASADESRDRQTSNSVSGYASQKIEGWTVFVSEKLSENHPKQTAQAIVLLAEQLRKAIDVLPADALQKVQRVPIWLSPPYENARPTGEYHPGAEWLRKHGRHPRLHRCIEFTNTAIFEREIQRMPVMVLHELAHAFHHQILGFDHADVQAAYARAKDSGDYDLVQRGKGKKARREKAYAMTNAMEYFAESSEDFFGINDFYPFNRTELAELDPDMEKLLIKLWGAEVD